MRKLGKACNRRVEAVIEQILVQERVVFAYHVSCLTSGYPHKMLPKQPQLLKSALERGPAACHDIPPGVRQHLSLVLTYIHSHVDVFAKAVVENASDESFGFVVTSVIPSAFGYFSSEESLKVASVFYTHVLANAPPKLARRILAPFFNSLASFRYVEAVMSSFTTKFGLQLVLNEESKRGVANHGLVQELYDNIIKYIPLLPASYGTLIQVMKTLSWTVEDIRKLLISKFFFPMIKTWVMSSPFAAGIDVLRSVVYETFNDKNFQQIYQKLVSFHSCFELPSMFRCFNLPYSAYTVSIAEVLTAFRLLKKSSVLPLSIDLNLCESAPRDDYYIPLVVNVFPHESFGFVALTPIVFSVKELYQADDGSPEYERTYRAILRENEGQSVYSSLQTPKFEALRNDTSFCDFALKKSLAAMSKEARSFETLVSNMVYLKVLTGWCELSNRRVTNELLLPLLKTKTVELPATLKSNLFLARVLFLYSIENRLESALKANSHEISKLERNWMKFLERKRDEHSPAIRSLSRAHKTVFWAAVEELSSLPNAPLHRQYEIISSVLQKAELIDSSLDFLLHVAVMADSRIFASRLLLFSTLAINGTNFIDLMPESDVRLWAKTQSALLGALHSRSVQTSFLALQAAFMSLQ